MTACTTGVCSISKMKEDLETLNVLRATRVFFAENPDKFTTGIWARRGKSMFNDYALLNLPLNERQAMDSYCLQGGFLRYVQDEQSYRKVCHIFQTATGMNPSHFNDQVANTQRGGKGAPDLVDKLRIAERQLKSQIAVNVVDL